MVTFQIVIASDGYDSFTAFNYLHNGMGWIMGDGKLGVNQLDVPAQAGFDSEDGRNVKLPNSGTTVSFVKLVYACSSLINPFHPISYQ